jgi:hypothetical protein
MLLPSRLARACGILTLLAMRCQAEERFTFDDWIVAPLRVHLLTASNAPAVHTTLKEADVHRILKKINGIWAQAGISFWIESLVREEALPFSPEMGQHNLRGLLALRPEATKATNVFHLYYVKKFSVNGVYLGEAMFVKDTAALREVPGGIDEPLPRVSSHEIGHAFTLQHCTNESHLMFRGTTGTNLDSVEIRQARDAAKQVPWIQPASAIAKSAAESTHPEEARRFYARLAVIPLDEPSVQTAREKAAGGL